MVKQRSRRSFLKKTSICLTGITIVPSYVLGGKHIPPSDRINIGFIGLGKQSGGLAGNFINSDHAQIVAGCDVWTTKNEWFQSFVKHQYAEKKKKENILIDTYVNYHELLSRKDLDAVVIATPDHWHATQAIAAMIAGKHVYCEKPMTHRIAEGRQMVDTAKSTGKIVQIGSMQRSWENFRKACELVRNGYLGDINTVLVNVGDPAKPYDLPEEALPKEVDWPAWCGPAPLLKYNHRLAPANNQVDFWPDWRLYDEVGGGILTDWGAHMFDIAQWGLGMDHSGPVDFIPPTDTKALRGLKMIYENGVELIHEDFGKGWGVRFIGSEGSLDISRQYFETNPMNIKEIQLKNTETNLYKSPNGDHGLDWLLAIKNKKQPCCPPEVGHRSASVGNLANIAYKLNRNLKWIPQTEEFENDVEANQLKYRKHS